MSVLTREKLQELLGRNSNVEITKPFDFIGEKAGTDLDRWIEFSIDGQDYKIQWHCNIMKLYHHNLTILFGHIVLFDSWPNSWPSGCKLNLILYLEGEVACIIPVEK